MTVVSTGDASKALKLTPQRITELVRAGDLEGTQLSDGTWLVETSSFAAYENVRASAGRPWTKHSSWALLYLLSDFEPDQISATTASRVRRRIRESTATEIATKVSKRSAVHHFSSDDREKTARALFLTGRSATDTIETNLAGQNRVVDGYIRNGTLENFIDKHLLVPDTKGDITIYDRDESTVWKGFYAPRAVVAADLARSTSTRERSEGLQALDRMRTQWLSKPTG